MKEIENNGFGQELSIYDSVWDKDSRQTYTLGAILGMVRDGSCNLKERTTLVRSAKTEAEFKELKKRLIGVTFNGTFSQRNGQSMLAYSNVTAIDLDHFRIREELMAYRQYLINHHSDLFPFIVAIFISPSGKGLKVICHHDNPNPNMHYNMYKQLESVFGVDELDHGVFDISRLTFLCYDPDIYISFDVKPFHFVYDHAIKEPVTRQNGNNHSGTASYRFQHSQEELILHNIMQMEIPDSRILNYLDRNVYSRFTDVYKEGSNRQLTLISYAKQLCRYGVLYENALKKLTYFFCNKAGLDKDEVAAKVAYTYATNEFGSGREEIKEELNKAKERRNQWENM